MIGARLKKLRKEKKINQAELASAIGVEKSAISLYETNKNDPLDKTKVKIAKFFDISLDYLLGVVDEDVPYYDDNKFLRLPENLTEDEKSSLTDFIDFIDYKKNIKRNVQHI